MQLEQYIGIAAGVFTSISLLPQLFKIIREKTAKGISVFMLLILMAGLSLWAWYGVLREDYPIIITNSFSLLANVLVLYFTIKFKARASKKGKGLKGEVD
jgi:MtN3 and saliva related transmembrane protein